MREKVNRRQISAIISYIFANIFVSVDTITVYNL